MKNILILYNPYYQIDVIEQHLKVLIDKEEVAFGKIRVKFRDMEHNFKNKLEEIYKSTDKNNFLQLFLTDYSSLFVAKVIKVTNDDMSDIAPSYYKEKGLDVEKWFIISDIRELVRNDFESIRDNYLANFTTPNFNNHTYAIYGNAYVYPLIVDMKQEINYFSNDTRFYTNVYKSQEFLSVKDNLINYSFGSKLVNLMHPDSIENIISAELEYQANKQNPLYDFSSVVVKYSKTMEQEIYMFAKALFKELAHKNSKILDISYSVQGINYTLSDIFTNKPNLGTYKFLFKNYLVQKALTGSKLESYITKTFPKVISELQDIRNETVHAKAPKITDVINLRAKIIGVGQDSILSKLLKAVAEVKKGIS